MNHYQSESAHTSTPSLIPEMPAEPPQPSRSGSGILPGSTTASEEPVGLRIRRMRLAAGISVREMAQRLGVSRSTVQRYESRETIPKKGILLAIAEILGTNVDWLLYSKKKSGAAVRQEDNGVQLQLQEKLRGFIDRLNRADLSPNDEASLCQALGYLIDIFGGIAGNWSEADRELRVMNIRPEVSAQDSAVRNAAINELFRRKMTRNTENIRKIAECLPFLWGENAQSYLEAMRHAASGDGFIRGRTGSLRRRGGRWYYRFYLVGDQGKPVQREFAGGDSREEAEEHLRRAIFEYKNGLRPEGRRMKLGELLELWLGEVRKSSRSNGTLMLYQNIVGRICRESIASRGLREITAADLQGFFDRLSREETGRGGKRLSAGYLRIYRAVLQGAFRYAVFPARLLSVSPMENVTISLQHDTNLLGIKAEEAQKTLSHEQFSALCQALAASPVLLPVEIAYYTGLRVGEACGLCWEDINMERRILTVRKSLRYNGATHRMELSTPKSGKARTVLFGEKLHNILQNAGRTGFPLQNYCTLLTEDGRQHYVVTTHPAGTEQMQPVNFVCRQKDGSMVSPDLVEKTCRRAAQAAGIPSFHFHLPRHTYTTNLLRGGASPRDVQELLGHAELSTTMNVYAHSNEEEKRRAACLLDQLGSMPGDEEKNNQNLSETV